MKITIMLCITSIVGCILMMSYNEYINRYEIISTNDNNIYIFDKKSTVVNMISNGQCSVINTKLPQMQIWNSGSKNVITNGGAPQGQGTNDGSFQPNAQSDAQNLNQGFVS